MSTQSRDESTRENRARVLVVDDDPALASLVAMHLTEWGFESSTAHHEQEMWQALDHAPDLVLLDVFLGPSDGSRLVADVHRRFPEIPILMVTRSSDVEIAVRSMRNGARDYILKPIDIEKLERSVRASLEWSSLQGRLAASGDSPSPDAGSGRASTDHEERPQGAAGTGATERTAQAGKTETPLDGMIGECTAMQRLRTVIRRAAPTSVPILLLGETGTGKELAARAIHRASSRASGPFIAVNAAAVPHELIESELFGHEKGSFTGASERKIGFCERAHGGTLFLDEIGEMAPDVQSKLLRFLQDHEVQRVGAQKSRVVDVRVVAATNIDPAAQIRAGRLREDLYYRLRGVQIHLPPLRERGDDVRLLAEHFLARAGKSETGPVRCTPAALDALAGAPWPGNVRQLENTLREAAILSPAGQIDVADLPRDLLHQGSAPGTAAEPSSSPFPAPSTVTPPLGEAQRLERSRIAEALASGDSPEDIAAQLEVSRATLYRRLKKYGLSRPR